ncbi:unnamed protein product, partial [Ectocarpus sp. 8 AP-2014]
MRLPQIAGVVLLSIVGGEGFFSPCAGRQVCSGRRSAPINAHRQPSCTTYRRWDSRTGGSVGLLRGGGGRSWTTRRQSSSLGLKNAAANDEEAGLGDKASLVPFSKPITLQGIELTWDIVAILVVYFVQGALGLARQDLCYCSWLATTFFFKDELHLAPAEVAALSGLFTLPWVFKPLYGFLSDGLPVFGYRRRSYMVLAGLLGASGWFCLANFAETPFQATAASIVASLGVAVSDVVADSIVVEKARDSDSQAVAGGLQSLCWGSAAVGGITSAYFSGSLLETMTTREVFSLTTYLPLLITVCAIFIDEKRLTENMSSPKQIVSEQASALWSAIKNKSVWLPALFIFLWRATPSSDSAYFFFLTNDIGEFTRVGPEFLGRVRLGSSIASLVGVWIFQSFLKETKISKVLFWTAVAAVPL